MVWVKRSVMTFKFKGRPRRGLLWAKKVYAIWFEFAKASPRNIPHEFGDLRQFQTFEEWWRHPDYGFELFCEPIEEDSVQVVSSIDDTSKDYMYLKINLNEEPQKLKQRFRSLLKKCQSTAIIDKGSQARYRPSVNQKYMKLDAWVNYLNIWKLRDAGMSRKSTYEAHYGRKWIEDDLDALRNISRACQRVEDIFKSIELGTFP